MAKGYMCFVYGQGAPKVIHTTFETAMWQMKELARKFPDQEVMLFHLEKRAINKAGKHTPLPCHIPSDFDKSGLLDLKGLVFGAPKKDNKNDKSC